MKFAELLVLLEYDESAILKNKFGDKGKYFDNNGQLRVIYVDSIVSKFYVDKNGYLASPKNGKPTLVRRISDAEYAQFWYRNGKLHRVNGPAVLSKRNTQYWLNGKEYTKKEFDEYVKGLNSKEDLDMLSDLGQTFE